MSMIVNKLDNKVLGIIKLDSYKFRYGFSEKIMKDFLAKYAKKGQSFDEIFTNYSVEYFHMIFKHFNRGKYHLSFDDLFFMITDDFEGFMSQVKHINETHLSKEYN